MCLANTDRIDRRVGALLSARCRPRLVCGALLRETWTHEYYDEERKDNELEQAVHAPTFFEEVAKEPIAGEPMNPSVEQSRECRLAVSISENERALLHRSALQLWSDVPTVFDASGVFPVGFTSM
jgi:hypothetical protein